MPFVEILSMSRYSVSQHILGRPRVDLIKLSEGFALTDLLSLGIGLVVCSLGAGAWYLCQRKASAVEAEIEAAKSWPRFQGKVTRSHLMKVKSTAGVYPTVHYEFECGGVKYNSARMFFGGFTGTRAEAEAFIADRPVGAPVDVYCDPTKPNSAVLVPIGDGKTWRQNGLWLGATFALIGLIIGVAGVE